MEDSTPSPGLFEGTAWYYSRYRGEYPQAVFDTLVRHFRLDRSTHVLDLGCGTGQIAIPLAARGAPVYAVDPDAEMLAEGIRAEERAAVQGVSWMRGDDKSIEQLPLMPITLCTFGASLHWMDRELVLKKLDGIVVRGGGLAVLSGGVGGSGKGTAWSDVAKEVITEFLGPDRRAGGGVYKHPAERHEVVLARSPFGHLEAYAFASTRELTVDDIVGLQLSTSYASPAQLGKRVEEFKRALCDRLLQLSPSGRFTFDVSTELLLATR